MASSWALTPPADKLVDQAPDATRGLAATLIFALLTLASSLAWAQNKPDLERFQELTTIKTFSEVGVSLHRQDAGAASSRGITGELLSEFLRQQAISLFPGIELESGAPLSPAGTRTSAALSCRVWIDESRASSVFQVRCQISKPTHRTIIEDASFGYGPPEQVSGIIREQISYILGGFAGVMARLNSER